MGKLLVVGSFCATIVTSMACDLVSEKIYATIIGSALVGFLSAHRMLKFNRHDPALLQRVSENVKAAQELLSESAYGQYRKETEGVTFSTNALGWSNLLDTLKHPLFIFTMFSTGVVMFLSPSFTEYSIGSSVGISLAGKAFVAHALTLLLLSGDFAGIALRLLRK